MPSRTTYWRCDSCWETSEEHQLLRAPNPFDASADDIVGCPHCKEADHFTQGCDLAVAEAGRAICGKPVTSGTPTPNGGYVHRCLEHGPRRIGFSETETTPIAAQGIEAATAAETVEQGSVHESPVGNADAPKGVGHAQ